MNILRALLIIWLLQSSFQLKVLLLSSFSFFFRTLNTDWGWKWSNWNDKLHVEKICRLFVHKVGKNLSLGYGRALQKAQIIYSIGHYLRRGFLLWSHWCCHYWTTLQGYLNLIFYSVIFSMFGILFYFSFSYLYYHLLDICSFRHNWDSVSGFYFVYSDGIGKRKIVKFCCLCQLVVYVWVHLWT